MEVFVGSLNPHTTRSDVMAFLKSFARDARIRMVDQKLENNQRAYYAIADFDSDRLALKAIKKFSGSVLRGEKVMLREYFHRSYSNERRALNWRDQPWTGQERRNHERRLKIMPVNQYPDDFGIQVEEKQQNNLSDTTSVQISAYSNMARKL
jgi:RNA recognition motif-containing protein